MSEPNRQYHQALSANRKLLAENARLKSEVERLTKAGDAMQDDLKIQVWPWASQFKSIQHWNAAKEGKQS